MLHMTKKFFKNIFMFKKKLKVKKIVITSKIYKKIVEKILNFKEVRSGPVRGPV